MPSNLNEHIHRLGMLVERTRMLTVNLRAKNSQLLYPVAQKGEMAGKNVVETLGSTKPLIPLAYDELIRLEDALTELSETIDQTLTI